MRLESTRFVSYRLLRGWLAAWLACAFGIFAFSAFLGLGMPLWSVQPLALGFAACVAWISWRHPLVPLDEKAASPLLRILFVLMATLSLVQLNRLCVFVVSPEATNFALGPHRGLGLPPRHLCMTAYFVASQSITTVPNVYDEYKLYSLPTADPAAPRTPRTIGPFDIDAYEYPPPFLLGPRVLAIVAPQFLKFRMLWFGLYGSILLIGLVAVSRVFDPVIGTRVLLLSPLVLGADITIGTLQVGNIQAAVIALSMLSMVLFARKKYALGGALLALVTVSKLFPCMLIVYLVARREWRAVAWTVGLCAALVAVSLLDTGVAPYVAFLHHLPRLLSGEAFPVFRRPGGIATNLSVPGLFFKLKLFGIPNGSFQTMRMVGSIYTLIVLAITVVIGMRKTTRNEQPIIWLTILVLASLRSPFLPTYGLFPVIWLLILLAATSATLARPLSLMLIAWAILNIALPVNGADPRIITGLALLSQTIIVILLVLALKRQKDPSLTLGSAKSTS